MNTKIILLHGALGCSNDMNQLATQLKNEGLQPHLINFSGHGQNTAAKEFGIRQFSNELLHFIRNNGLQGSAIFGYSMGGFVALHCASTNTELTGPIVTFATKLDWTPEIIRQESGFCNIEFLTNKVPAFVKSLESKHNDHLGLLQKTAHMIQAFGNETFIHEQWQPQQKVLMGVGDRDKLVTFDECKNFAKSRKSCGLFILPYTAHPFEQADPVLLTAIIKKAIEK